MITTIYAHAQTTHIASETQRDETHTSDAHKAREPDSIRPFSVVFTRCVLFLDVNVLFL